MAQFQADGEGTLPTQQPSLSSLPWLPLLESGDVSTLPQDKGTTAASSRGRARTREKADGEKPVKELASIAWESGSGPEPALGGPGRCQ